MPHTKYEYAQCFGQKLAHTNINRDLRVDQPVSIPSHTFKDVKKHSTYLSTHVLGCHPSKGGSQDKVRTLLSLNLRPLVTYTINPKEKVYPHHLISKGHTKCKGTSSTGHKRCHLSCILTGGLQSDVNKQCRVNTTCCFNRNG